MGVYNPNADMPVSCAECDTRGGSNCFLSNQLSYPDVLRRRHPDCPLVEVPTPHGRLIDADSLGGHDEEERAHNETVEVVKQSGCGSPTHIYYSAYYDGVLTMTGKIRFAPTIIEAEDNDED